MAKRTLAAKSICLTLVLAIGVVLAAGRISPAAPVRTFKMTMTSYKFTPDLVTVNEGDRVIIQLEDIDPKPDQGHALASPYFSTVDLAVRGQAKIGTTRDGWRMVQVDPRGKAEVEFTAKGRGQWQFICPYSNHAANGQTGAFVIWPAEYRQ